MKHLHRMQCQLIYKGIVFLFLMTFLAGMVHVMDINAINPIESHPYGSQDTLDNLALDSEATDFLKNYQKAGEAFLYNGGANLLLTAISEDLDETVLLDYNTKTNKLRTLKSFPHDDAALSFFQAGKKIYISATFPSNVLKFVECSLFSIEDIDEGDLEFIETGLVPGVDVKGISPYFYTQIGTVNFFEIGSDKFKHIEIFSTGEYFETLLELPFELTSKDTNITLKTMEDWGRTYELLFSYEHKVEYGEIWYCPPVETWIKVGNMKDVSECQNQKNGYSRFFSRANPLFMTTEKVKRGKKLDENMPFPRHNFELILYQDEKLAFYHTSEHQIARFQYITIVDEADNFITLPLPYVQKAVRSPFDRFMIYQREDDFCFSPKDLETNMPLQCFNIQKKEISTFLGASIGNNDKVGLEDFLFKNNAEKVEGYIFGSEKDIAEDSSSTSPFNAIEKREQEIFDKKTKQQKMASDLFKIMLIIIGTTFYIMRLVYKRKNKRAPKISSEFHVDDSWEKIFDTAYSNKWKKELELLSSEEEEFFEDEEDYEDDEQDDKDLPVISKQKDKKEVVEKRSQYSGFDEDAQTYNKKFGTPWWSGKKKD